MPKSRWTFLVCPRCGEWYPDERICPLCKIETVPNCPFCNKPFEQCECNYNEVSSFMVVNSRYIRKAFIEGFVKGLYGSQFKDIELIILYGSSLKGDPSPKFMRPSEEKLLPRDIDLLIINSNAKNAKIYELRSGDTTFDVIEISKSSLLEKLQLFDPVYTEPILSGEICFGNPKTLKDLREKLENMKTNRKIIAYLYNEGKNLLNQSILMLTLHVHNANNEQINKGNIYIMLPTINNVLNYEFKDAEPLSVYLTDAIINAAFACSYLIFAKYYTSNKAPITCDELLQKGNEKLLIDIIQYKKHALRSNTVNIKQFVELLKKLLKSYEEFEKNILPKAIGLSSWIDN